LIILALLHIANYLDFLHLEVKAYVGDVVELLLIEVEPHQLACVRVLVADGATVLCEWCRIYGGGGIPSVLKAKPGGMEAVRQVA
jgi:hypothetical protein